MKYFLCFFSIVFTVFVSAIADTNYKDSFDNDIQTFLNRPSYERKAFMISVWLSAAKRSADSGDQVEAALYRCAANEFYKKSDEKLEWILTTPGEYEQIWTNTLITCKDKAPADIGSLVKIEQDNLIPYIEKHCEYCLQHLEILPPTSQTTKNSSQSKSLYIGNTIKANKELADQLASNKKLLEKLKDPNGPYKYFLSTDYVSTDRYKESNPKKHYGYNYVKPNNAWVFCDVHKSMSWYERQKYKIHCKKAKSNLADKLKKLDEERKSGTYTSIEYALADVQKTQEQVDECEYLIEKCE